MPGAWAGGTSRAGEVRGPLNGVVRQDNVNSKVIGQVQACGGWTAGGGATPKNEHSTVASSTFYKTKSISYLPLVIET